MLSINLYELLLEKYLDFKTYLIENKNNKGDRELYDTIQDFLITEEKYTTRYNIYKSLMDLLKKKYELSDLTDDEFVNEMVLRYGKSKSIFDEDVDFDTFTNIYDNYIEYDEENLKDIDNFMKKDFILDDRSLDYFKVPEFVNNLLELGMNFKYSVYGDECDIDEDDIFYDVLEYVSDELKHNKNFILKLMTKAPSLFYCIDEKFRDDKEIVLKVLEETRKKAQKWEK